MDRKYAKDYEADLQAGIAGKEKQYRYIGDYYEYRYQKDQKSLLLSYTVLTILLTAAWIAAGFINSEGSRFGLIGILYALCIIPIFYLMRGLFSSFLYRETRLERFQYEAGARRIGRSSIALCLLSGMLTVAELIFAIVQRDKINDFEYAFLVLSALICLFSALVRYIWSKNPCILDKNEAQEQKKDLTIN